jgi:hypothetical protein
VVFSYVGYETFKQKVSLTEISVAMGTIQLKPLSIELGSIDVKASRDKTWDINYKRFQKIFLGEDKASDLSTILNPYGLEFEEKDKQFTAHSNAPIEIENIALGYRLYFTLTKFQSTKADYTIEGNVRFEALETNNSNEKLMWETNRQKSYLNSRQHLFKSIIDRKIGAEGYELFTEKEGFSTTSRLPVFSDNLGKSIQSYDTTTLVSATNQKDIYAIFFKGRMEAHYTSGETYKRVYKDITYPVSWLWPNKKFILVNKDGVELNPLDVTISGEMSSNRVAHLMPLNYIPSKIITPIRVDRKLVAEVPLEKIYLHTDKPYYYPGEVIWFKGYVNYNLPSAADTLSRTAYIELIDQTTKVIVLSKILPIDSATFYGEITLPDSLKSQNYILRSYTNWNRNFKEDDFFYKPIPILKINEAIEPLPFTPNEISSLKLHCEKPAYKPREKIYLILQLSGEGENLASNLSLSVVDDNQVVPIKTASILNGYKITSGEKRLKRQSFIYPIEYGISFNGRFLNNSFSPEKASLNVVQMYPSNFTSVESDENGNFSVRNLQFSDTSYFSIQANNKRGELYGRAELRKRSPAPTNVIPEIKPFKTISTQTIKRSKSIFDADEAQLLKEVVIKDTKDEPLEKKRPYGKPNYVLARKDINTSYPNMLYALQGKFPGLIIRETNADGSGSQWKVYTTRSATSSISNVKEVNVLVNDVFMGGTPASILSSMNPEDVASVELKTGINSLYGSAGGFGILSIYTNQAVEIPAIKNINTIKVAGYSKSKKFKAPEYSSLSDLSAKNFSSLIYWNPLVKTNAEGNAIVSFFATDQQTKYRIIVEGVSSTNEPIHSEYTIEVKSGN